MITNVFIILIEDGFITTKYAKKEDFLFDKERENVPVSVYFRHHFGMDEREVEANETANKGKVNVDDG